MRERAGYRICVRCVMDTTDPEISFDEFGVCNHCRRYEEFRKRLPRPEERSRLLAGVLDRIRRNGKGKEYDCILGLSGGADSSYVALKASEYGLRPLVVHFDSGWNSEAAVNNIENIVRRLGFDLYTVVAEWEEMRDLQRSYLKASVINADIPQDYAFLTVLFRLASEKGIRYFLTGYNYQTEFILPERWVYRHRDVRNLKSIHRRFGSMTLKEYPLTNPIWDLYLTYCRIRKVDLLYYLDYDKKEAISVLEERLGWKNYGAKHYESIWTRFFQGYYLPKKFGVDKRKAHLSSLVVSGQMTREEALRDLGMDPYPPGLLETDKEFIMKKLNFDPGEFEEIMNAAPVPHEAYGTDWYLQVPLRAAYLLLSRYREWAGKSVVRG